MTTSNLEKNRNCVSDISSRIDEEAARANGLSSTSVSVPATLDLGEFNSSSVEQLVTRFQTGITTSSSDNDPITRLIREYGSDAFYSSVTAANSYFLRPDVRALVVYDTYPLLYDRINTGLPFTPVEIADFIIEFGYSPTSLIVASSITSTRLVFEFDSFYNRNFTSSTMGSFCALLPNIFGTIGVFFSALDNLESIVNRLKNFALNFSLSSLLNNLKNNITKVIDKVVQKVKNIIQNFSIENVISQVSTFVNQRIVSKFYELKEGILAFFDPNNIENFKKKIGALIDYATSVFKNPTLEEVQYLLYRFCGFISLVENSINALKNPIENLVNSYKQTLDILRSGSSRNTARAVTAGAFRYTLSVQDDGINSTQRQYEIFGNTPPLTNEDYRIITQWNEGNGDSRVVFRGNWVRPPAPSGLPSEGGVGRDGWERVDIDVRGNLMRVQRDFGKQLIINSGYRPQVYNDALSGSAKGTSLHISGLALDVSWNGFNVRSEDANRFIGIAERYGFTHIGRYGPNSGNFIHIGVGRNGRWEKA